MKHSLRIRTSRLPGLLMRLIERRIEASRRGSTPSSMDLTFDANRRWLRLSCTCSASQSDGTQREYILGDLEWLMPRSFFGLRLTIPPWPVGWKAQPPRSSTTYQSTPIRFAMKESR